jgi:GH24 family phage-related lysozyme (muramidase)
MQSLRKYNKAGGKVLRGLDNRRKDEEAMFIGK